MRNIKSLGLALVAVVALLAAVTSSASAQGKITVSAGTPTLTITETGGEGSNRQLVLPGGTFVECPGSTYTGHAIGSTTTGISNGATTVTITPHYKQTNGALSNCKGPLGIRITIDMNGCDYVLHIGATTGEGRTYAATYDIVCPVGQEITWTMWTSETQHKNEPGTVFCTLHIPSQVGLTGGHATDTSTTDKHIELTGTVTGITISRTESATHEGILCANEHITTASWSMDMTVEDKAGLATLSLSH